MFLRAILCLALLAAVASARAPTVFLVRHGEKPANPDDHSLTFHGLMRAQCLREVFGADSGYEIGYIMAPTMKGNGEHGRAFKTVSPLAEDLGLDVDTHCSRKKPQCVADAIRSYDGPGNILIAWRHKNMAEIQEALGSSDPLEYPDERFDLLWTIPFPYNNITEVESERCPGLDTGAGIIAQY